MDVTRGGPTSFCPCDDAATKVRRHVFGQGAKEPRVLKAPFTQDAKADLHANPFMLFASSVNTP